MKDFSPVAQSVEQVTVNHWVGGSSPSGGAIICEIRLAVWRAFSFSVDQSPVAVDIAFMIP
jgi:hypothetical protein